MLDSKQLKTIIVQSLLSLHGHVNALQATDCAADVCDSQRMFLYEGGGSYLGGRHHM